METWNLIISEPNDAFSNMGIDEAVLDSTIAGEITNPTLRFYSWTVPSISIGRFQQIKKDINLELCEKENIPIVRRPTGGRAVLHETEEKEITYAVILPSHHPLAKKGIQACYCAISESFVKGLNRVGVKAKLEKQDLGTQKYPHKISCFSATTKYEITLNDSKIIGSAQVRKHGAVLQHGAILIQSSSYDKSYFNNGTVQQIGIQELIKRKIGRQEVVDALIKGFEEKLSVQFVNLTLNERILVRSVQARQYKYLDPQWTFYK